MQRQANVEELTSAQPDTVQIHGRTSPEDDANQSPAEVEALVQTVHALERRLQGHEERRQLMDRRMLDLKVLARAARGFARMRDHRAILQGLLRICLTRTHSHFALGLLWDADRSCFKRLAGEGANVPEGLEFACEAEGPFWDMLCRAEAFTSRAMVAPDGSAISIPSLEPLGAKVWLPLTLDDEVLGLVLLGAPTSEYYTNRALDFLSFLAHQASTSMYTALLHLQHSRRSEEVGRSLHNLRVMYEINQAVNATQDMEEVLEVILTRAIHVVEAHRGCLLLWDESKDQLGIHLMRSFDEHGELVPQWQDRQGEALPVSGVVGQVFSSGEPCLTLGSLDPVLCQVFGEELGSMGALMCAPLKVEGEVLGVVCMVREGQGESFLQPDLNLVHALSNQAAMAIYKTRLHELATRDGLTCVLTRRFFMRRFRDELRRASRFERHVSLLLVDVDHFKQVNDTFGHLVGDAVLQAISSALRANIRDEIDIVGRYGGDEFALVLPETDTEGAKVVADRLLSCVRELQVQGLRAEHTLSLSIGVASFPAHDTEAATLLQCADEALYEVKRHGRDGAKVWQPHF